jgi:hypothetical protein
MLDMKRRERKPKSRRSRGKHIGGLAAPADFLAMPRRLGIGEGSLSNFSESKIPLGHHRP